MNQQLPHTLGILIKKMESEMIQHRKEIARLEGQIAAVDAAIATTQAQQHKETVLGADNPLRRQELMLYIRQMDDKIGAFRATRSQIVQRLHSHQELVLEVYQQLTAYEQALTHITTESSQTLQKKQNAELDEIAQNGYLRKQSHTQA